jgi:hypothetical protein
MKKIIQRILPGCFQVLPPFYPGPRTAEVVQRQVGPRSRPAGVELESQRRTGSGTCARNPRRSCSRGIRSCGAGRRRESGLRGAERYCLIIGLQGAIGMKPLVPNC